MAEVGAGGGEEGLTMLAMWRVWCKSVGAGIENMGVHCVNTVIVLRIDQTQYISKARRQCVHGE
jgi:hypothetical protein